MNSIYLVKYSAGFMDDYHEVDVFVTFDNELAERYVERFNSLLVKLKEHCKRFENENGQIKDEHMDVFDRWHKIKDVNNCYITSIEIRE